MDKIEKAIEEIREGNFVIVVDDEDRENEGDFIIAAEKITPEKVNFMLQHGRGVLCVPLPETRCAELDLVHQVSNNTSMLGTPFTVTVDKLQGCSTGVSAEDRAATIRALADPTSKPQDFGRPGHINPLYAQERGVLQRAGHTEAAVDLARLAGLQPVAALIEIMNEDGTMARMPQLEKVAEKYGLSLISIKDLIAYRMNHTEQPLNHDISSLNNALVERGETVSLPTEYGDFMLTPFRELTTGLEHIALVKGEWNEDEAILCRVHSSCMTGDIFGSCRCDCGDQLHKAMEEIDAAGKGDDHTVLAAVGIVAVARLSQKHAVENIHRLCIARADTEDSEVFRIAADVLDLNRLAGNLECCKVFGLREKQLLGAFLGTQNVAIFDTFLPFGERSTAVFVCGRQIQRHLRGNRGKKCGQICKRTLTHHAFPPFVLSEGSISSKVKLTSGPR